MRAPDREDLLEINRARLRVWEWGDESAPPLICVHGAHDHGRMWDGLAPRLADELGYRVIAPDLRGLGWTDAPPDGYEKETLADDLISLLDAMGLERVRLAATGSVADRLQPLVTRPGRRQARG